VKHPKNVKRFKNLEDLAETILNLGREGLKKLFLFLAKKFEKDSNADGEKNHLKLASNLCILSKLMSLAKFILDSMTTPDPKNTECSINLEDLAEEIGDLDYKSLKKLFSLLVKKLEKNNELSVLFSLMLVVKMILSDICKIHKPCIKN
jgi:hypothetical protein